MGLYMNIINILNISVKKSNNARYLKEQIGKWTRQANRVKWKKEVK